MPLAETSAHRDDPLYLERTAANHLRHPMFVGLTKKSALRAS
jgi:hypothetical protein